MSENNQYKVEKILDKYYIYKLAVSSAYPEEGKKKYHLCKIKSKGYFNPKAWQPFSNHMKGTTFYTFLTQEKAEDFIKFI